MMGDMDQLQEKYDAYEAEQKAHVKKLQEDMAKKNAETQKRAKKLQDQID